MSISAYKEVTEWKDTEFHMPQHTYLFDGKSNALAYAKEGQDDLIFIFKAPLKIDTRRRKFEKVKHEALDTFGASIVLKEEKPSDYPNWQVKSDSGKTYIVELISGKYHCNCVGYAYRGVCKHSKQIKEAQEK